MAEYEIIYGQQIKIPQPSSLEEVLYHDLPQKQQKWVREELPAYFNQVQYAKSGDLVLTPQQEQYADQELMRCKSGIHIFINGNLRYITKKYYFYLQWWVLEDGSRPEYRDCDRRYFIYLEYFEAILWCLGTIRGKKRREGASSQATANLVYECIFYTNTNCGLISKTKDDSRDTFTDMVAFGYKQLPPFLKPKQVNREESVTEYKFEQKIFEYVNGQKVEKTNYSKVNYRAPVLNAYDRGRMSRILLDEFGKLEKDVPASKLFGIVAKTLVKGVKRVGFVEMPSTCNSMSKGGSEFRLIWDKADMSIRKPTINRLVRYFTPAWDGYEGFIDEFGESVIGEPTHEQYQYLVEKWVRKDEDGSVVSELSEEDIKLGAKEYILGKRREGLEGDALEEEIRMNPTNEMELFMAANENCIFDSVKLNNQKEHLKQHPVHKRKVIFYRDLDNVVKWRDADKREASFCWEVLPVFPLSRVADPKRTIGEEGVIGVDGYSNSQGGKQYGSKASAWVFTKYDIRDPENTGILTAHLYGRPPEKEDLHNQVLLCAEFLGYSVYYEFVADDYYTYFKNEGKLPYLAKFPLNAIAPDKKKAGKTPDRHYGFPTTPFALTKQNDTMITYVKHYSHKIGWIELCDDALAFDPNKRTPSDMTVSAMIALVGSLEQVYKPPPPQTALIKVYRNSGQPA